MLFEATSQSDLRPGSMAKGNGCSDAPMGSTVVPAPDKAPTKPKGGNANKKTAFKPSCQVVGCCSDLTHSRAYYRRYRICENHFRMPSFSEPTLLCGVVCRFCQQCAKFEVLSEFEGDKRSCRRQLNRHNERRKGRKGNGGGGGGGGASCHKASQRKGGAVGGGGDSEAEDGGNSGDSGSGRLVDGPLADMLQSSSIQRSSAGGTAYDGGEVFSGLVAPQRANPPADMPTCQQLPQHMTPAGGAQPHPSAGAPRTHAMQATMPGGAEAPAPTQQWQAGPMLYQSGSPPCSMSEVTVEVGRAQGGGGAGVGRAARGVMDAEDHFDAALAAAAQELMAHWQQEDQEGDGAGNRSGGPLHPSTEIVGSSDTRQVVAEAAVRASNSSHLLAFTLQQQLQQQLQREQQELPAQRASGPLQLQQQRQPATEPLSADSSVHGPAMQVAHCDPAAGPGMDRMLEMLGQSECFDTIRADMQPLVRDLAAPPPPQQQQQRIQMQQLQQQPSSGTAATYPYLGRDSRGSQRQHTTGSDAMTMPGQHPTWPQAMAAPVANHTNNAMSGMMPKQESSPFSMGNHPGASFPPLSSSPHMGGGAQVAPWLSNWNAAPASGLHHGGADHLSSGSNSSAMYDVLPWQQQQQLTAAARLHSSEQSQGSFTPQPQVQLHPLLANLPATNDPARPVHPVLNGSNYNNNNNNNNNNGNPQHGGAMAIAQAAAMPPPASQHYPNIWSTPVPQPTTAVTAPTAQPYGANNHSIPPFGRTSQQGGSQWQAGNGAGPSSGSGHAAHHAGQASALDSALGSAPRAAGTLSRNLGQAHYLLTEQSLTRLSIKLHGVTPEALPADLRAALTEWLAATDVRLLQGFIRPGCVHLSLDCVVVGGKAAEGGASASSSMMSGMGSACGGSFRGLDDLVHAGLATAGVAHMASALPRPLARLFSSCTLAEIQSPGKLVLMEGEAVWSVASLDKRPMLPVIHTVQPLAILAGSRMPQSLYINGAHLEGRSAGSTSGSGETPATPTGCQVLVRSHGRFWQQGPALQVQPVGDSSAAGAAGAAGDKAGWWRVGVDAAGLQPGLAVVECQTGRLLSNWRPVLVVDDVGVHREILQLQPLQAQYPERVNSLVCDLALLLQLQSACLNQATTVTAPAPPSTTAAGAGGVGIRNDNSGALNVVRAVDGDEEEDESDFGSEDEEDESGDEDVQSLTAPSVSEGGPYEDDQDEDDVDGEEEVNGMPLNMPHNNMDDPYYHHQGGNGGHQGPQRWPPAAGGAPARGIAMAARYPGGGGRMVSWDSETFAELGTPAVHSSWGSNRGAGGVSLLASADTDMMAGSLAAAAAGTTVRGGRAVTAPMRSSGVNQALTAGARGAGVAAAPAAPQHGPGDVFTAEVRASLAVKAVRLLAFACDAGWPCTARLLLDLLTMLPLVAPAELAGLPAGCLSLGQLVPLGAQQVLASVVGGDGFTPLHRAARSGSAATVREVLNFARGVGLAVNPGSRGSAPVSALHLAAMCPEGGPAALALLRSTRDAPVQWFVARAEDGQTPAQYAAAGGCGQVTQEARLMVQMLAMQPARTSRTI